MSNISLGIHMGHDRSVSVVVDGNLVGCLATERIDRIKHSKSSVIPFKLLILYWVILTLMSIQ